LTRLLLDIRDESGKLLCDHVWVTDTAEFFDLREGDEFEFTARARYYVNLEDDEKNCPMCGSEVILKRKPRTGRVVIRCPCWCFENEFYDGVGLVDFEVESK